ncbi:MAG: hypothetical protein WD205_09415, partial [Rhodothermales bacterium]
MKRSLGIYALVIAAGLFMTAGSASAQDASGDDPVLESSLEVFDITTGERSVVYRRQAHFEAPNWSIDGSYFIFNQDGLI